MVKRWIDKKPTNLIQFEYTYCSIVEKTMIWVLVIIIVWLTVLSVFFLLLRTHYKRLVEIGGKKDLIGILEKVIDRLEENRLAIDKINKLIERINQEGELHIQKIGLIRFNPFPDMGGNQSFVLSLLDKNNNGIVISSLHARSTTRWYAKAVVGGKGKNVELSKEEERAILEAGKNRLKIKNFTER